ncbi:uncharacterized protein A4U43_C07F26650 [Asparagus officinalis]|uniref:Uncharacterized protein n=1 Tax=Asparagus officinalis TaxID=4686 RepID=A0A5P1EFE3_ASPOF|nr:uncharacterized protein A4U43_C07F26650 [Asparagus officinalis]
MNRVPEITMYAPNIVRGLRFFSFKIVVNILSPNSVFLLSISGMEVTSLTAVNSESRAKATLQLGSETFSIKSSTGILSQQLAAMKEESMGILKEFITKHNAPNDVPDESIESSTEDEAEELDNPPKKSKKQT